MFVPHYFLHMIGLAYPRDSFFFAYSIFGVAHKLSSFRLNPNENNPPKLGGVIFSSESLNDVV